MRKSITQSSELVGEQENAMQVDIPGNKVIPATDVLKFLLPGLCHLTTDETARDVIVQENGHTLLAQYFSYHVQKLPSQDDGREVEVCCHYLIC